MAAAIVRLRGAARLLKNASKTSSAGTVLVQGLPGSEDMGGIPRNSGCLRAFVELDGGASNRNAAGFEVPSVRFFSSVRRFAAVASVGEGEEDLVEERAVGEGEERRLDEGLAMFSSVDSLVNVNGEDVLKYVTFSEEDVLKFFGEGLPGGVVMEFEATKSNSLMIRSRVLQLCNFLERHVTGKDAFKLPAEDANSTKAKKLILLDGPVGSGKSVALAMLVQWARARGWLVFYIPSGKDWTHGSLYYRNEETGLVETLVTAQMALEGFLKSHSELLDTLPCNIPDPVLLGEGAGVPRVRGPQEFILPEGATLKQLVEKGLSMSHAGVGTVVRLRKELSLIKDVPVLIAIDDYNSRFVYSQYGVRARKPIHAHQLEMVRAFRPIAGSKEMMVAAFSHSNAVGKLPLHLPDVPKGVRYEFPRYLPVEANTALQYYHRVGENVICKQFLLKSPTATGYILPRLLTRENVRQYGGIAFDNMKFSELAWSRKGILRPSPPISSLSMGGVRYKTKYSKAEKALKRATKKKKEKAIRVKLKQIRMRRKLRKLSMTPEETFLFRIEKCKKKIAIHEVQLKKFELPPLPEPDPDPEILTPEQLYALKKLGYKNKNYVPVGRRGIYGGTIQNMHMHWKKHETVRIDCDNFPKEKIKDMGEQLERLSGGTVIDIHQGTTIIMWRGRNYKRPKVDIPIMFKNFNKRKALIKSKHEQSIASLYDQIGHWERDLRALRVDMAREAAARARWLEENPGMAPPEPPAPVATEQSDYDSDEGSDISDDDDITAMEDLGSEYDSDSDYEYPDSDDDISNSTVSSDRDDEDILTSSNMDSDDEWEPNAYASGDETESDSDAPTRVTHAASNGIRRKI